MSLILFALASVSTLCAALPSAPTGFCVGGASCSHLLPSVCERSSSDDAPSFVLQDPRLCVFACAWLPASGSQPGTGERLTDRPKLDPTAPTLPGSPATTAGVLSIIPNPAVASGFSEKGLATMFSEAKNTYCTVPYLNPWTHHPTVLFKAGAWCDHMADIDSVINGRRRALKYVRGYRPGYAGYVGNFNVGYPTWPFFGYGGYESSATRSITRSRAGNASLAKGMPRAEMLMFWCILAIRLDSGSAVTCTTCFDQCVGCSGGATCPFLTRTSANRAIVTGAALAAGAATAVSLLNLLPLKFLRVLSRSVLDSMKTIARRPAAGTPIDLTTMTEAQISDAVITGTASTADAMREVIGRIPGANQAEVGRLNAMQSTLANMEKAGASMGHAGVQTINGQLLGAFTFAWVQAAKVVRSNTSGSVALAGAVKGDAVGAEDTEASRVLQAKILRPQSMEEFADFQTCWLMICHALGLGDVLILGNFLRDVVHDTISLNKGDWRLAHELFLVYLEVVETTSDPALNISNVYARGAQDTMMQRAVVRSQEHFSIFRGKGKERERELDGGGPGAKKWNGAFNGKSQTCCLTFNLGKKEHPASALNDNGSCKYNHICDHFVTDKGPRGQCGGKHARSKCDNPNKCDKPV